MIQRKLPRVKRLLVAVIQPRLTVLRVVVAALVACGVAYAFQKPSPTSAVSVNDTRLQGVVVDAYGLHIPHAHVQIIDANGESLAETLTQPDETFEITSPAKAVTVTVYAQGVGRFTKELNLAESTTERLEVKLTRDCSANIKQVIPKELDLHHFLVEIHYYGAFGDCPEKTYRLWGTGEASVTYSGCGRKTFRDSTFIEPSVLTSALAEIAKEHSTPVCDYYAGGIDAPRVELTIFSGSEPRLVISHDEGDEIQGVSDLERQLEKLIDPNGRMQSFAAKANKKRGRN